MDVRSRFAIAATLTPLALAFAPDAHATDGWDGGKWRGCASAASPQRHDSLQVVGLTSDQRLICFNERRPQGARDIGFVSGVVMDTRLVGIDFRVQDGMLYGVGDAGGVYQLDTRNATATLVNRLTVPLSGTSFGVDFNPAADRLRIVSDTGQNLRHNINQGGTTVQDDPLDYPVPTQLNSVGPAAAGVTGSAYTNNDLTPDTATTLYSMDTSLDQISIQSPPNDGTLAATGKLGVDAQPQSGFDIYSTLRDGATVGAEAFASLTRSDGGTAFYKVTLSTGKATLHGSFGSGNEVIDIAIPLDQL
jgi:Domain of unknown function (DUF4394)